MLLQRKGAVAVAAGAAVFWVASIRAQSAAGRSSYFQYATLVGSTDTITARRVPVATEAGTTVYRDVTIKFNVDADGNLSLTPEYPQFTETLPLMPGSFLSGNYAGPGTLLGGKAAVIVNGPGAADGGTTVWSLSAAPEASTCTYPASATWYVGPIERSPLVARLKRNNITSTAWSYGVAGITTCANSTSTSAVWNTIYANWDAGALIGVSQSGNAITIASFTRLGLDNAAPVDQVTYRLVP